MISRRSEVWLTPGNEVLFMLGQYILVTVEVYETVRLRVRRNLLMVNHLMTSLNDELHRND